MLVLSPVPRKGLGSRRASPAARYGMTVIWSSPPTTARIPRIAGSAKAALMSAARASGVAPTLRVVGYSTGIRPVTSVSRRIACSCTAGKAPAAANDGDRTAICSPRRALGGWTRSCAMRVIEAHRQHAHIGLSLPKPPGDDQAPAMLAPAAGRSDHREPGSIDPLAACSLGVCPRPADAARARQPGEA